MEKGSFGYIDWKKKKLFKKALLFFGSTAAVFLFGLLVNKFSKANVFTIAAVLFVLPSARVLVAYLIIRPYHSVSKELQKKVEALVLPPSRVYTDLVFTSPEKVMHLSFAVLMKNQIVGFTGNEKDVPGKIEAYLTEGCKERKFPYKVKIYGEEKQFINYLKSAGSDKWEVGEIDKKIWETFFLSLMV